MCKNMMLLIHCAKINLYIYSFNHSTNSVYNVPVALLHIMMYKLHPLISSNSDSKYQYVESKKAVLLKTESRMVVTRDRGFWEMLFNGTYLQLKHA